MNRSARLSLFLACIFYVTSFVYTFAQTNISYKVYTAEKGLPHNNCFGMYQDHQGYVWIGTDDGLAKFDGANFKTYTTENGLLSDFPTSITEGPDGKLWIGSWKGGVNIMDGDSFYVANIDEPLYNVGKLIVNKSEMLLTDNRWQPFPYELRDGKWCFKGRKGYHFLKLTKDTVVEFMKVDSLGRYDQSTYIPQTNGRPMLTFLSAYLSKDNRYFYFGRFGGVWEYDQDIYFKKAFANIVGKDTIYHIHQDEEMRYWLGGRGKIYVVEPNGKVNIIQDGLPNKNIVTIKQTVSGDLYLRTGDRDFNDRSLYKYSNGESIDLKKLLGFVTPDQLLLDKDENLWLSTYGEGVYLIPNNLFRSFQKENGVENLHVTQINESKTKDIYIAGQGGVYYFNEKDEHFYLVRQSQGDVSYEGLQLSYGFEKDLLSVIKENKSGSTKIIRLNRTQSDKFPTKKNLAEGWYNAKDNSKWFWLGYNSIQYLPARSKYLDDPKRLYTFKEKIHCNQFFEKDEKQCFATSNGIYCGKFDGETFEIVDHLTTENGLPNNYVSDVVEGEGGVWWLATKGGITQWKDGKFNTFTTAEGLLSNYCKTLLYDHHGLLWIGSNKGLSYFDGEVFHAYTHKTGLVSSDVNKLFLDSKKRLWIATNNGISRLDLENKPKPVLPPSLYFEEVLINNKKVPIESEIAIGVNDNLRIHFKAIDFIHPEGLIYEYRLAGGTWQAASTTYLDFNNLQYKKYQFEVRAKKSTSTWSKPIAIDFQMKPPMWLTWWAKMLYFIDLVCIVYFIFRWRSKQLEKRNLELEQIVAARTQELEHQKEEISAQNHKLEEQTFRLQEMDKIKSNFFSNISHEIRTPLTLIIGPAEKLMQASQDNKTQHYSKTIMSNAQRLLRLINQLLDFSKLESGKMILQPKVGHLNEFIRNVMFSFELLAEQKNIKFKYIEKTKDIQFYFDHDKFEKVFFNLLSNAFKFTPIGGEITLVLDQSHEHVSIEVADTGIGITEEKLPYIFDRFYQVDASRTRAQEGTGIGLSLVKELVELHKGQVSVNSTPSKGTTFFMTFPFTTMPTILTDNAVTRAMSLKAELAIDSESVDETLNANNNQSKKENTILVVEDNPELRQFICAELVSTYHVIEANNGEHGIETAFEHIPDLIISDVMMPKKDGFELTSVLKQDLRTSHIPIILLTAKASFVNKIEGLERGADDYIMKPFNSTELLLRLRNMLKTRLHFQEKFGQQLLDETEEDTLSPIDSALLDKIRNILEIQMHDPAFGVEALSKEIGMSQSNMYRKLKALTNLSSSQFIRSMRLKKAAQLLKDKESRVSEVALAVGFNELSYFDRCFKKEFGVAPSQYQ